MIARKFWRAGSGGPFRCRSLTAIKTAARGFRSSCASTDRNSSLRRSASINAFSVSRRSVISRKVQTRPTIRPSTDCTFENRSITLPSASSRTSEACDRWLMASLTRRCCLESMISRGIRHISTKFSLKSVITPCSSVTRIASVVDSSVARIIESDCASSSVFFSSACFASSSSCSAR